MNESLTTRTQHTGVSKAGPSPGFSSRGDQKQEGGTTFLKYCIGCMQQPGGQTWNGGHRFQLGRPGTTGPPLATGLVERLTKVGTNCQKITPVLGWAKVRTRELRRRRWIILKVWTKTKALMIHRYPTTEKGAASLRCSWFDESRSNEFWPKSDLLRTTCSVFHLRYFPQFYALFGRLWRVISFLKPT